MAALAADQPALAGIGGRALAAQISHAQARGDADSGDTCTLHGPGALECSCAG